MVKCYFIALLFLPLFCFGQGVSTVETGNDWQRVLQKGGIGFKKYIGLPRLDSSRWGTSGIHSDLFVLNYPDSALMRWNPYIQKDERVLTASDSGVYYITPETFNITIEALRDSIVDSPTNLSIGTVTTSTVDVNSSTGTPATLPGSTPVSAGVMSASDKAKLDGISPGANNYTHPNSGITAGTYTKATYNSQGHATAGGSLLDSDIPQLPQTKTIGLPDSISSHSSRIRQAYVSSGFNPATRELSLTKDGGGTDVLVIPAGAGGLTGVDIGNAPPLFSVTKGGTSSYPLFSFSQTSQGAGLIFSSPALSAGVPSFRRLSGVDIDDNIISLSKLQSISSGILLGRYSTGTGGVQGLTLNPSHFSINTSTGVISAISSGNPTNLSIGTVTTSTVDVNSSTGTPATLPGSTPVSAGVMSASDKAKLDGISPGANDYSHPNSGITAGTYTKATYNSQGHATAGGALLETDIPSLGLAKTLGLIDSLSSLRTATNAAYNHATFDNSSRTLMLYRLGGGSTSVAIPGGISDVSISNAMPLFSVSKSGTPDFPVFGFSQISQPGGNLFASPVSGSGAPVFRRLATTDIDNNLITLDKLQNVQAMGFLGNKNPSTGQVGVLTFNPADFSINTASGQVSLIGGSGGGTVTSVNVAGAGPISVTGGPIVNSGTLQLNWTGTGSMLVADNGAAVAYPTIGDGTISWQGSGIATGSGTFKVNQGSNGSININVPGTDIGSSVNGNDVTITSSTGSSSTFSVPGASYTGSASVVLSGGSFQRAALVGDVTAAQNNNLTSISNNVVTNAKLAQMPGNSVKANMSGLTANATDMQLDNSQLVGRTQYGNVAPIKLGAGLEMIDDVLDVVPPSFTAPTVSVSNPGALTASLDYGDDEAGRILVRGLTSGGCYRVNLTFGTAYGGNIVPTYSLGRKYSTDCPQRSLYIDDSGTDGTRAVFIVDKLDSGEEISIYYSIKPK